MEALSSSYSSVNDIWRLSNTVKHLQETQQEHAVRLLRLEQRQNEDVRIKSVWGQNSSYSNTLGAVSQPSPANQPSHVEFANFDEDHSASMMRSLQLDTDDEPRRLGSTSRANSVRFDESANQGQWAQSSRASMDLFPRTPSGLGPLGGLPMIERSSSHRSDGNKSSAGHSAISGRANSMAFDLGNSLSSSQVDLPGLAPGFFFLGSVPSIIRCWLHQDFKHDTLLYAAVCTGSYQSLLDINLIEALSLQRFVHRDLNGVQRIKLPVYLPEAVPHPTSSRSSSPAPQLPSLTVDFAVVDRQSDSDAPTKAICIFLGSDMLRAHSADILFSSNCVTLFDDERHKLSVPFVRPENEELFKTLSVTAQPLRQREFDSRIQSSWTNQSDNKSAREGDEEAKSPLVEPVIEDSGAPENDFLVRRMSQTDTKEFYAEPESAAEKDVEISQQKQMPILNPLKPTMSENREDSEGIVGSQASRSPSLGIWSNWRRDGGAPQVPQNDWAKATRSTSSSYARPARQDGIKVLKPSRQLSRSSSALQSTQTSTGPQSRFFDNGKRKNGANGPTGSGSDSGESLGNVRGIEGAHKSSMKENAAQGKKRSANPIGGASAFGWLNSNSTK